jgi:imidazolonepropionase-like amidohydrolase
MSLRCHAATTGAALLAVMMVALTALPSAAQERPVAFTGARLFPIASPPIDDGVLVVHRGRIVAAGPARSTTIPPDAERRDASGRVIMPGLVDTHSHIGGPAGADGSDPMQPECRVVDAINVRDAALQKAQAGGITTANLMPGSGHLMSGQTVYVKLKDGRTIEDLAIREEGGAIAGGIKMANGTNSRRDPPFPGTRGKSAAIARTRFVAAQEYQRKITAAKGDATKMPDRDLAKEALVDVLERRRVVHHHTHRHDDVLTVLRLQREFGFRVVLHHVSEAWKVADEIAAAKVPCSIIVIDSPGGKLEAADLDWRTGAVLERAGVATAFHTDDPITDSRLFLRSAAFAVRAGMSREGALAGLTLAGARMLDLDRRIGSLEAGKDADFIVLSGDPLSVDTHVLETWVEGARVFDRSNEEDRLYATGGWGASAPQSFVWCCHGDDWEDQ